MYDYPHTMTTLTSDHIAKVRALMEQLHSFTGLIKQIEDNDGDTTTAELAKLAQELDKGLEVACELAKALNRTALSLHLELLARKRQ